ncbi:MAG: polysaccharide biosynthesis tyrosine autokinase [Verrucomicrobia bacterium]|nr:polysaccharide biosynthesis tyrosine autokinase [Verrucomicrobiota bacterium]
MDPIKAQPPQEARLHFLDYWRIIRIRKTVILAVFFLVVITATLVTFVLPESYSSMARIKVERDGSDISGLTEMRSLNVFDPYFIQTEFEVIQSEVVLGKVVESLDLNKVWGQKYGGGTQLKTTETITLLKGRIDLKPVRSTSLIEITVYSEDKDEAALIANAIADEYKAHRLQKGMQMTQRGIKALEDRFNEQEARVKRIQDEVDAKREELQISEADAVGNAPAPMLETEALRKYEALRIDSQSRHMIREKQLTQLQSLPEEDLREVLPRVLTDSTLTELISQKNLADLALVKLAKDLSPDHPEVVRTQAQVDTLDTKIKSSIRGIMTALESQVATAKEEADKWTKVVEEAKQADREKAAKSRPYFDKKRELDEAQRFRQILSMKIVSEGIDMSLPKDTVVEIVDRAQPGLRPVRPNKPVNIALGVIIGLVVGVGLAFFIEYLDTSVKTIDDVERTLQSPVLGVIPQNVGYLLDEGMESPHAEAYRVLRTNLLFSSKSEKANSLAVVSAGAGEGKSTTVLNLATVFAQSGQRVLVVDSDLRRPTLHKMLRVTNNLGLTNYLLKQNTLEEVIQTTSQPTLDFMASGRLPSSSLGILNSAQMRSLIGELKKRYDFVIFDSPPIMGVSDASILASEVDMTMQVIQYRRYPQPMNIRAKQLIEKVGGNLVGIVLNNINMSQDESYYYYSGYYHDYYSKNEEMADASAAGKDGGDKAKVEIKQKY